MSGAPERELRKGAAFTSGARVWSQAASALLMLVSTALLTPALFGQFVLALSVYGLLSICVGNGVYEYVMNHHESDEAPRTAFTINMACAAIVSLAAFAASFGLDPLFHSTQIGGLLRLLIPAFFLQGANLVMESVLMRRGRLTHVAGAMVISDTAGLVGALAIMAAGGGVIGLVAQRVIREALLCVSYWFGYSWRVKPDFEPKLARDIGHFAFGIASARLANAAANSATDFIIGAVLSPAGTGLYRLANRLLNMAWDVLNYPFRSLLWVQLPPLQRDDAAFGATTLRMLETFGVAIFATLTGIAVVATPAFELIFRPEWRAAAPIVCVLAALRLIVLPSTLMETVVSIRRRTNLLLQLDVIGIAIGLVALWIAARYGILAVAISQLVTVMIIQVYSVPIVARHSRVSAKQIIDLMTRLAANALAMVAVVLAWLTLAPLIGIGAWPRLTIAIALGIVTYVAAARRFTPIGLEPYATAFLSARNKAQTLIRAGKAG